MKQFTAAPKFILQGSAIFVGSLVGIPCRTVGIKVRVNINLARGLFNGTDPNRVINLN